MDGGVASWLHLVTSTPQSACADSSPAGEPFGAVYNSHIKPALKGEVDMSVSEWTEGLKKERRFSFVYLNPSVNS